MSITLEEHAPRARCYSCGTLDIASLCHHCGRALCSDHRADAGHPSGAPDTNEFVGLGLESSRPSHCQQCAHIVKGRLTKLVIAGIGVTAAGIIVAIFNSVAGFTVMLVGIVIAVCGYIADRRRLVAMQDSRPPLPAVPTIDSIAIRERLYGRITLDPQGRYASAPDLIEGEIKVAMTIAPPDRDRFATYRRRFNIPPTEPVELSAGFAVIRGEVGLDLAPDLGRGATAFPNGTGIALRGLEIGHPFFDSDAGQSTGQWKLRVPYSLPNYRRVDAIPLWITPSLVPESDQRSLEIDVQWNRFNKRPHPPTPHQIALIELDVPESWGNLESVTPSGSITPPHSVNGETVRTLQWKRLPTSAANGESLTIKMRFEDVIQRQDTLRGKIDISFNRTLSGAEEIVMYDPLGEPRLSPSAPVATIDVLVNFALSLERIRYQDVRIIPDRARDGDKDRSDDFAGVVPDYRTLMALTTELSEQGYYVKRVIENPPRSGGRADLINRYWDIAGRKYDGVYPIDFHITVTGEEVDRGGGDAQDGNTTVRVTAQGAYANEQMKLQIEQEWERLHAITFDRIDKRRPRRHGEGSSANGDATAGPTVAPLPPKSDGQKAQGSVRTRLDSLVGALIEGRISEETYRDIKARMEREIGGE